MSKQTLWKFELGTQVRDIVTSLKGIIDARAEWLNGCLRYSMQPPAKKGAREAPKSFWIDEGQLEEIGPGVALQQERTGGPRVPNDSRQES